jgi:hypothetical protein
VAAAPGKVSCNTAKTVCATVDRSRRSARIVLAKAVGVGEVFAIALRGGREDQGTQVRASVKKGRASFTVKLGGNKSRDQVWVLRSQTTFISSFQVG